MSDSSSPGDDNPQTAESAEGETAPTQQEPDDGSSATGTTDDEDFPGSDDPAQISDDQLPEDLRPTDDNPLAKPAEDDDEDSGMNLQEQAGDAGAPA